MSKKNSLSRRKKQYNFDLKREKEDRENKVKKLQAKQSKMKIQKAVGKTYTTMDKTYQVDGTAKKKKGGFKVGKRKVKTKLSALTKAKVSQAMELDK